MIFAILMVLVILKGIVPAHSEYFLGVSLHPYVEPIRELEGESCIAMRMNLIEIFRFLFKADSKLNTLRLLDDSLISVEQVSNSHLASLLQHFH